MEISYTPVLSSQLEIVVMKKFLGALCSVGLICLLGLSPAGCTKTPDKKPAVVTPSSNVPPPVEPASGKMVEPGTGKMVDMASSNKAP